MKSLCQLQESASVLADVNIVTAHYGDFRRGVLTSCDKKNALLVYF
jgi:hypothetical protein